MGITLGLKLRLTMNRQQIEAKVKEAVSVLVKKKGYVAPMDIFIYLNYLTEDNHKLWRTGQVAYLERVMTGNLKRFSFILSVMSESADKMGLKPSLTVYKGWAKNKGKPLRFSKSGLKHVEKIYSTHYVSKRVKKHL
jgi:hypothetical protein